MRVQKTTRFSRTAPLFLALCMILSLTISAGAAFENTHKNTGNQASDIALVALTQMGYTDNKSEYSKYGAWYGLPNSYWCAMFVSWCADQAGVPATEVKPFASCTAGTKTFQKAGVWQDGPYWGGSYEPNCGDLIFYDWYGAGTCSHVGIVLYVEDGWVYSVEGNTLANRLDKPEAFLKGSGSSGVFMPDVVMVRRHTVDSIYIRGYATPNYAGSALPAAPLQGLVDVQAGTVRAGEIARVVSAGLMAPMSSHTFGPLYGVTRGEYLTALASFFHMDSYEADTTPFADVPESSADYNAVMAFRFAGFVSGTGGNCFQPNNYITPAAARLLLEKVCVQRGVDCPNVGYVGNPKHNFLQRYELAHALTVLMDNGVSSQIVTANVMLNSAPVTLEARNVAGCNYATVGGWQTLLSGTEAAFSMDLWQENAPENVPEGWLHRTSYGIATSDAENAAVDSPSGTQDAALRASSTFVVDGVRWYKLRDLADATGVSVAWDQEANCITLTTAPAAEP